MNLLETAQSYHDSGLCVIPIRPKDKRPAIDSWKEYQARVPDQSERWEWFGERPDRNLAVVCGKVSGNLFVLDFDDKAAYIRWGKDHLEIVKNTCVVRTSKGYHVWLRGKTAIASGTFLGGEIKAEGGYVVAPPSIHPDGPKYEFVDGHDYQHVLTVDSLAMLDLPIRDARSSAPPAPEILPQGSRRPTLMSLAGTMRRRGLGREEIAPALHAVNKLRCRPMLPDSEIEHIADSVTRYDASEELEVVAEPGRAEQEETGWQIFTLEDAFAPRHPIEYIVDGLFAIPSLSIVYGPPGSFKTMLMVDMALCVSSGLPWLPPLPGKNDKTAYETLVFPVLWCDFDNGPRRMHERVQAIAAARGVQPPGFLHYVSMPTPWLDASDWDSVTYMANVAQTLQCKLIVIDNLRDVSGSVDENSADMGLVMSHFRRLAEDLDAALVLIHHQRKSTGFSTRSGDTLRGHSSIEAAIDLALLMEREEHSDTVMIRATKCRGEDVLPFGAVFTYDHKADSKDLGKVKFWGVGVEDVSSDAALRRTILEVLNVTPDLNKGQLVATVKGFVDTVGINRIRQMIDLLVYEGKLMITDGANNSKFYGLPKVHDHFDVTLL